jgi:hypothetical protein
MYWGEMRQLDFKGQSNPLEYGSGDPPHPRFMEALPTNELCPPATAVSAIPQRVLRFCSGDAVTKNDITSHNAMGKRRPENVTECRWASCSVFHGDTTIERLRKLIKSSSRLRALRYVVEFGIDPDAGMVHRNGIHIDFWPYADFDPSGSSKCLAKL